MNRHLTLYTLYALRIIPFKYWVICVSGISSETHMVSGSTHKVAHTLEQTENKYTNANSLIINYVTYVSPYFNNINSIKYVWAGNQKDYRGSKYVRRATLEEIAWKTVLRYKDLKRWLWATHVKMIRNCVPIVILQRRLHMGEWVVKKLQVN